MPGLGLDWPDDQTLKNVQTVVGYLAAVVIFFLVTLPAQTRARVQLQIERSRILKEHIDEFSALYGKAEILRVPEAPGVRKGRRPRSLAIDRKATLLSVLNSRTLWKSAPGEFQYEEESRYVEFVEQSSVIPSSAQISVEHLQKVVLQFRRINAALATKVVRRDDLVVVWNDLVVWTYPNRIDFLINTLGASRQDILGPISALCAAYPAPVARERDYFHYVFRSVAEKPLAGIGRRVRMRMALLRPLYVSREPSRLRFATVRMTDRALRLLRVY